MVTGISEVTEQINSIIMLVCQVYQLMGLKLLRMFIKT